MKLATCLREARLRAGYTQAQVGKMLGVGANTVNRWERGARWPDADRLVALADIYNVSLDYLLGRQVPKEIQIHEKTLEDFLRVLNHLSPTDIAEVKVYAQFRASRQGAPPPDWFFKASSSEKHPPHTEAGESTRNKIIGPDLAFHDAFPKEHGMRREILEHHVRPVPPPVARLLTLPEGTMVLYRKYREGINREWHALAESWIPMHLLKPASAAEFTDDTTLLTLLESKGIHLMRADERLFLRPADGGESRVLGIAEGATLLNIQRVCFTDAMVAAEVSSVLLAGERWEHWYRYPIGNAAYAGNWPWPRP